MNRAFSKPQVLIITAAFLLLAGCENLERNEKVKLPTESEIKNDLLQKIPDVSGNFSPLSEDAVISFANGEYPIDLVSDKTTVFVAENNKGKIYQIDIDSKEVKELSVSQESGKKLLFPTSIGLFNDRLWLFDNEGLKAFDKEGKNLSLVKVFSSVNHFEINSNGIFYANSLVNKSQADNPLILQMNERGEIVGGIGKRNSNQTEEEALISLTDKFVVLAFKNRPIIQIYDKQTGTLNKEFTVSHAIFPALEKTTAELKEEFQKEQKTFLPKYFAGIKTFQDKIFVLLSLPHIEIAELDFQGNESSRYQAKQTTKNLAYFGFDVRLIGERHQFIIGTMIGSNNPNLKLFSYSNKNKDGGS